MKIFFKIFNFRALLPYFVMQVFFKIFNFQALLPYFVMLN